MADHIHNPSIAVVGKLRVGTILTALILVAEVVGGLLSNSLALLSDAGHVFVDIIALSLSSYGVRQAERPASGRMTFGYHRVGVLIALVNAVSILAIVVAIFFAAYHRLQQPPEVNSRLMLVVAVIGLGVNLFVAFVLHREQQANINVRSAFWHVLGDALASVGVIIGGAIMPKLMGHLGDVYNMSLSFLMPMGCFAIIAVYGYMWAKLSKADSLVSISTFKGH